MACDLDFNYSGSYYNSERTDFADINGDSTTDSLINELTTSYGWKPAGYYNIGFNGTLDGNNHIIKNLYINRSSSSSQALIGCSSTGLSIKNLELDNVDIEQNGGDSGSIFGYLDSGDTEAHFTFQNCKTNGKINCQNTSKIGGMIGEISSTNVSSSLTIENCTNNVNIYSSGSTSGFIGCANLYNIIINNCINNGNINSNGSNVAGFVSYANKTLVQGTITNCYDIADVVSTQCEGGVIGRSSDPSMANFEVANCFYLQGVSPTGRGNYYNTNTSQLVTYPDATGVVESVATTADMKAKIIAYFTAQDGWKADTNNINNGYPIFSWQ